MKGQVVHNNIIYHAGYLVIHQGIRKEIIYSDFGALVIKRTEGGFIGLTECLSEIEKHKPISLPVDTLQICVSSIDDMCKMFSLPEHVIRYILDRPACDKATHGAKGEKLLEFMSKHVTTSSSEEVVITKKEEPDKLEEKIPSVIPEMEKEAGQLCFDF